MGIDRERQELPSETVAWDWFKDNYPAIASWLKQFKKEAKARTDKGDYWWELRACAYYKKFSTTQNFLSEISGKAMFPL